MRKVLVYRDRGEASFRDVVTPLTLTLTVCSGIASPLSVGDERYTEKEIAEYGQGDDLSFGELMSVAKDNYVRGGDAVYECWDQDIYDDYVKMFGPVKRKTVGRLFSTMSNA